MENSEYISTLEESSKVESQRESNAYSNRITRNTLQQNPRERAELKDSVNSESSIKKKTSTNTNETLPIKNNISNFNFKVVLIGNVSVGKSSIIKRFIYNEFNQEYVCTIGTELSKKSLLVSQNKITNLFIWDTCGQEKFRSVTRQYYRDTQAILLVFDLTSEKSFLDLQSWYDEALDFVNDVKCMFFLLGNKSDIKNEIKVNEKDIKNFMKQNHQIKKYFEVSAFTGHNIDLAFDKISQYLILTFGVEEINKNIKVYKKNLNSENNKNNVNKVKCC